MCDLNRPLHKSFFIIGLDHRTFLSAAACTYSSRPSFAVQGGWTALHCAAASGHLEVAAALIAAGYDKDVKNDVRSPSLPRAPPGWCSIECAGRNIMNPGGVWFLLKFLISKREIERCLTRLFHKVGTPTHAPPMCSMFVRLQFI